MLKPIQVIFMTLGVLVVIMIGYKIFKERLKTVFLFVFFFTLIAILIKLYFPSLF
ncbi:hypothetical protein HZB00_04190 [Candidatus Woesearchaeota archaeon]|nr:hypothetical protein [Candidatus Woesearchaeota archaeon]